MGIPLQDATNKGAEEFRVVEIVRFSIIIFSALVWPLLTMKKRDAVEVGAVRVSHPLRHPSLSCRKEWCNFGACFTHDDATPCGLVGASCMRLRRERKMLGILFNVTCYKAQDDEAHDFRGWHSWGPHKENKTQGTVKFHPIPTSSSFRAFFFPSAGNFLEKKKRGNFFS